MYNYYGFIVFFIYFAIVITGKSQKIMRIIKYMTLFILLLSATQNFVIGQSSLGMNFGIVAGNNGNIIQDSTRTFRNGYQIGILGNFGTYSFFISPGIYFNDVTINKDYKEIAPFEIAPRIKTAKAKLTLGYQTNVLTRKIKLKFGGGMNANYIISISDNDEGYNFDTLDDSYMGYNIDMGLDFFFLTFNISYEKSIREILTLNDKKSGLDFIILTAGIVF